MIYKRESGVRGNEHGFFMTDEEMRMPEIMPLDIYRGIVSKCVEAWLEKNKDSVLSAVSLEQVVCRTIDATADALKVEILKELSKVNANKS